VQVETRFQILSSVVYLQQLLETDFASPAPFRRRAEDILAEKKATYYFQIFSGVSHGFGTKGGPGEETQS